MRDAPPPEVLASWVAEELVRDADDAGAEFWYCSYCDGANGATRETVGHVASCPVGAAVAVLAGVRAAAHVVVVATQARMAQPAGDAVRPRAVRDAPPDAHDLPIELRREFRDAVQTLSNARRAEAWDVLFKAVRWALADGVRAAAPAPSRESCRQVVSIRGLDCQCTRRKGHVGTHYNSEWDALDTYEARLAAARAEPPGRDPQP